jgi:hypothetical protein
MPRARPSQLPSGAACSSWHVTGQPPDLWPSSLTLAGELCSVDVPRSCSTIESAAVDAPQRCSTAHGSLCPCTTWTLDPGGHGLQSPCMSIAAHHTESRFVLDAVVFASYAAGTNLVHTQHGVLDSAAARDCHCFIVPTHPCLAQGGSRSGSRGGRGSGGSDRQPRCRQLREHHDALARCQRPAGAHPLAVWAAVLQQAVRPSVCHHATGREEAGAEAQPIGAAGTDDKITTAPGYAAVGWASQSRAHFCTMSAGSIVLRQGSSRIGEEQTFISVFNDCTRRSPMQSGCCCQQSQQPASATDGCSALGRRQTSSTSASWP